MSCLLSRVMAAYHNQSIRLLIGQGTKENGIDDAEDGRVRANPESQRQGRHSGEAGILAKHSNGVMKIVEHSEVQS